MSVSLARSQSKCFIAKMGGKKTPLSNDFGKILITLISSSIHIQLFSQSHVNCNLSSSLILLHLTFDLLPWPSEPVDLASWYKSDRCSRGNKMAWCSADAMNPIPSFVERVILPFRTCLFDLTLPQLKSKMLLWRFGELLKLVIFLKVTRREMGEDVMKKLPLLKARGVFILSTVSSFIWQNVMCHWL